MIIDINNLQKDAFNNCEMIYKDLIVLLNGASEGKLQLDNSLFNGHWGALLFVFYFERYCDSTKSSAVTFLEFFFNELDTSFSNFSFCSGLSGPFWLLHHLNKYEFIDIDIYEVSEGFISAAIESSIGFINDNNFDFLHGCSGICNLLTCFSERLDVRNHLAFFVNSLSSLTKQSQTGISIPIFHYQTNPPSDEGIDSFSLAHGNCSYQIILMKILALGIEEHKCRCLIIDSVSFMLSNENVNGKYSSMFPPYLDQKTFNSRVSWCYGDLNVATVLWQCGKYLNNENWIKKAIEIYEFNSFRHAYGSTGVKDSCICHGTSGNALMYMRIWNETKISPFLSCAEKWFRRTHDILEFSDSKAYTKTWNGYGGFWEYNYGLLNGGAGVGLSLISCYINQSLPWEELLLIC